MASSATFSVGLTYFCFRFVALLAIIVLFSMLLTPSTAEEVTICTYNLWNVMFSWEIRMLQIADMVRQADCDVLMLQEVRLHADRSASQAEHLQRLIPEFQWEVTRKADSVNKPEEAYWNGWDIEGLSVLSKFPIGTVQAEHLSRSHGPDTNQRIALHVPVVVSDGITLNVVAVHLSYDRRQQCQNVVEILKYINSRRKLPSQRHHMDHVVVGGDFNTYPEFPDPVQLMLKDSNNSGIRDRQNKCKANAPPTLNTDERFQDVWEATQSQLPGYTFSNMPTPGMISRPDRILATTKDIRVVLTSLHGDNTAYKSKRSSDILFHRMKRVLQSAKDAFDGHQGYSCLQDCGPRGSCRCGVCVLKEDLQSCLVPDCEECSYRLFLHLRLLVFIVILHLLLAGYAAVKILVIASRIDQTQSLYICGWSCCLFNPLLITQPSASPRSRGGRILRRLGVGRLPPLLLLPFSLLLICVWVGLGLWVNTEAVRTVYSVMPEEYFPSDHLMLVARLKLL